MRRASVAASGSRTEPAVTAIPGREHGRHPRGVADELSGHPGVGRFDEAATFLPVQKLATAALGGGRVHEHVKCLAGARRFGKQPAGGRRVLTNCRHAGTKQPRPGTRTGSALPFESPYPVRGSAQVQVWVLPGRNSGEGTPSQNVVHANAQVLDA